MSQIHPLLKKLQWKENEKAVLIVNAPKEYEEVVKAFEGRVDREPKEEKYPFAQIFGTTIEEVSTHAKSVVPSLEEDALFWLCYPKKSSKVYKGSNCNRDTVAKVLAEEGFEPVRNIAIDDDWSALRFRKVEHIKKMVRKFAHTEAGKERTND
ncbi:DUF3052 domain-containing protein [Psychrobacillus sp. NEAU-3TGS]|uniref:DUF3052 domain-containing protein n=1 Tax=Psychrobacillus sp. NEAU-3TGS TaxID=2995412 RepID=UPI0024961B86|nr:DUF3052 domain-containing protein [Psychrobacillus sp. NEAU-3TGS]MDI2585936.1 DUF3052 domain-containing protein [Psychrobacillus sp. NEAU-3TGS]